MPEWFTVCVGLFLLLCGLLEALAGYRLFRFSLVLIGASFAGIPMWWLLTDYVETLGGGVGASSAVVVGGVGGCLGAVLGGFLCWRLWRVGVFVIGAALGVVVAVVLHITVFCHLKQGNMPLAVAGVLLGLSAGALSLRFMRKSMVVATSVLGAYAALRGVSLFAGSYTDELQVAGEVQEGTPVPGAMFGYLAGMAVLAVVGAAVQFLRTAVKPKRSGGKDEFEEEFEGSKLSLAALVSGGKRKVKKRGASRSRKRGGGKGGSRVPRGSGGANKEGSSKTAALLAEWEEEYHEEGGCEEEAEAGVEVWEVGGEEEEEEEEGGGGGAQEGAYEMVPVSAPAAFEVARSPGGGSAVPFHAAAPKVCPTPPAGAGTPAWLALHSPDILALAAKLNGDWELDEARSDSVQPLMVAMGAPNWVARVLLSGAPPPLTFELTTAGLSFQFHSMMLSQKNVYTWTGPNIHKTPEGGKHTSDLMFTPPSGGGLCTVGTLVHFKGRGDLLSTHAFAQPNKHLLKLQMFKEGKEVLELNRVFLPKAAKGKKK
jgi:hypothetical protein